MMMRIITSWTSFSKIGKMSGRKYYTDRDHDHYIIREHFHLLSDSFELNIYENHDLAIARSSSSRADPGLRVAFKCLNV